MKKKGIAMILPAFLHCSKYPSKSSFLGGWFIFQETKASWADTSGILGRDGASGTAKKADIDYEIRYNFNSGGRSHLCLKKP